MKERHFEQASSDMLHLRAAMLSIAPITRKVLMTTVTCCGDSKKGH